LTIQHGRWYNISALSPKMCNGTAHNVLSNETPESNAKASQEEGLRVRQVVVRELEGLEFPALVLRVHDDEADLVYIDDEQIEYDVPIEELNTSPDIKTSKAEIDEIWRKALDSVASNYSDDEDDTHPSNCDQGGKYVAADGTLIISHVDEKASSEQLANSRANSEEQKDCKTFSDSEREASVEQFASTNASPVELEEKRHDCASSSDEEENPSIGEPASACGSPEELEGKRDDCASLSDSEAKTSAEQSSTCASPEQQKDKSDDCDNLTDSEDEQPQQQGRPSFSSDSSDDDQPVQSDLGRQRTERLEVAQFCGVDGLELRNEGKLIEAEKQLQRSIDIYEEELGEDHPYTLTSRNNLANVLMKAGKLQEAEVEYRRCLASKLEQLGTNHPVVATTHYNLGLALSKRGTLEQAEDTLNEALRIQVQFLGEESPEAVKTSRSLCRLLLKQGKLQES